MTAVPDNNPALTAALTYAARGWRVLPIKPGTKRPPMQAWQEHATTDTEIIEGWWTGLYKGHGVGIATGHESAVWVLDVDDWEVLVDLEGQHGPLPATYTVTTGSGGLHYYFGYPVGMTITNANQLPRGLDVRGDGGQVVAPPSDHPESGQAYTQEHSSPNTVAQAPQWLLDLTQAPTRPDKPAPGTSTPAPDQGRRPGDLWAAQTPWAEILQVDGWHYSYTARDNGGDMWTRPGKEPRQGVSASVGHKGSDVLKIFTSSLDHLGLIEGETYTKLGYLAATRHNGDHSAAAAWLASQGHRENEAEVIADMIGTFPEAEPVIVLPPIVDTNDGDDWQPIDLAQIASEIESGERQVEKPSILQVEGHMALVYRARIGSLFGAPGGFKTWLALHGIAEVLKGGERAALIDWEDSADGTAARLLALGVTPDQLTQFVYFSVATAIPADIDRILGHLERCVFVVLDSAGEAMGAAGIDPNADGPVAAWMARIKLLTRTAARTAVLLLDHIPKDKEAPNGYAIGSQRKLAAVTGAAYRIETIVEPARGKPGKVRLIVAKDRLGNRAKGTTAAEVHIEPGEGEQLHIRLTVSEAMAATERGEPFRPTHLMERVSQFVQDYPECSTRTIREHVKGKETAVKQAIEVLIAEGYITTSPGPRRSVQHISAQPFTEASDLVDNSTSKDETTTGAPLVPTGAPLVPETLDSQPDRPIDWCPESNPPTGGVQGHQSDGQTGPVDNPQRLVPGTTGAQHADNTDNDDDIDDNPTDRRPLI